MDLKTKLKVANILLEKFDEDTEGKPKDIIADRCRICCVKAKTEDAKKILANFNVSAVFTVSNLAFQIKPEELTQFLEVKARYSIEYLEYFIKLLNTTSDNIVITMKRNYPIKMENEDFEVILAPRITEKD